MDSQPEQARAALSAIKSASKEALEELRAVLTPLRQDAAAPRSPAPGLHRLPELTRAARLSVEAEVAGKAPPLPAAVHLAAYRIIQESLTNVARHAGRARVTVRVTYDDTSMHVEVDDDGTAPSGRAPQSGRRAGSRACGNAPPHSGASCPPGSARAAGSGSAHGFRSGQRHDPRPDRR
jgi:signal transduction histidine kinase